MPNYTDWITEQIRKICETYKNRTAGSESVRDCMHEMETQLRDWCDDVAAEPFTLHPHAFMGSVPLQASLCICGVICFLLSYFLSSAAAAWISAVLFLAAISVWLLEYVFYGRAFDFLFPKKKSVNIYAERKARVESRQRIILCGHADAAFEMSFFVHLKAWMIYVLMVGADLGMFVCLLFGVLYAAGAVSVHTAAIFSMIEAVLLVVDISWLFFIRWRMIADGANDNLTGCLISMNILKELAEKDERLDYTDVCCLITDGEESGLRGAMAFAEAHRQELIDDHTMVIAIDTIHDPNELMIYHRGINFTQKNSPEVCELLHKAGLACGKDIPYTDFYPGANDSEAFSRNGIKAAAICAVQHTPSTYYHTRYDSWDNLRPDCIELVRNIARHALRIADKKAAENEERLSIQTIAKD